MNAFEFLELEEKIQVIDIGAAAIAEVPVYKPLLDINLAHLSAFDGDERQIKNIRGAYGENATIYNDFLFDGDEQTLYLASPSSGMTSLLKPSEKALGYFNGFKNFGHIQHIEKIQTKKLDDIEGVKSIDFLKMDIQGAELKVLQNGVKKLHDCLAIQLEVPYICLYENQPTFGEIDIWMRSQGFVPHCFMEIKRWSIAPTLLNNNLGVPGNQLLESDIVYVKDPLLLDALSINALMKYATIAHYCFQSYDLCVFIILELERRNAIELNSHQLYLKPLKASVDKEYYKNNI
ncbi:MAG: FkbM family methyltransferase [Chitinophagia bacterium]|nr:FkbM family methyltransferase [Chitinophagia bacterium]